jgi:hypothetical protein
MKLPIITLNDEQNIGKAGGFYSPERKNKPA